MVGIEEEGCAEGRGREGQGGGQGVHLRAAVEAAGLDGAGTFSLWAMESQLTLLQRGVTL